MESKGSLIGNQVILNKDVASRNMISDAFSESKPYAVGNTCIYENKLYKCKTATSGAWDATKWDETTVGAYISELKGTLESLIYKDDVKYIRGEVFIDNDTYDTYLKKIQKFISDIVSEGYDVSFDVIIKSDRRYDFRGSIYGTKNYGSGIFHNYQGLCMMWCRNNNVDTLYNITKTTA